MSAADEFRSALANGDVALLRKAHAVLFPHLPKPATQEEAETTMHVARTAAAWLNERGRCYSHAWLVERGLPSQLPDEMKPKAARLYPRVVDAVFVSGHTFSKILKPVAAEVQRAMSEAVEDCYANGDKDPELVRSRMLDARVRTFSQLLGTTGGIPHG